MSATKKSAKAAASKKATIKPTATHPSWVDMIKECISEHREEARSGVSRPLIKKYVENKYKLEIGPAQIAQLNKAIAHGAEKGTFVLPKGPSGKVKLPPKAPKADVSATKENKPATKATTKPTTKPTVKPKVPTNKPSKKIIASKKTATAKPSGKSTATAMPKKSSSKSAAAPKKAAKPTIVKKVASGKRPSAKKAVSGNSTKAKAAASKHKAPVKKATTKKPASKKAIATRA